MTTVAIIATISNLIFIVKASHEYYHDNKNVVLLNYDDIKLNITIAETIIKKFTSRTTDIINSMVIDETIYNVIIDIKEQICSLKSIIDIYKTIYFYNETIKWFRPFRIQKTNDILQNIEQIRNRLINSCQLLLLCHISEEL